MVHDDNSAGRIPVTVGRATQPWSRVDHTQWSSGRTRAQTNRRNSRWSLAETHPKMQSSGSGLLMAIWSHVWSAPTVVVFTAVIAKWGSQRRVLYPLSDAYQMLVMILFVNAHAFVIYSLRRKGRNVVVLTMAVQVCMMCQCVHWCTVLDFDTLVVDSYWSMIH